MSVTRSQERPYTITAQDGADLDGGTLYVLHDDNGKALATHAWPMPLELLAATRGVQVEYRVHGGITDDVGDTHERGGAVENGNEREFELTDKDFDEMLDSVGSKRELGEPAEADEQVELPAARDVCKVDGCTETWLTQHGPYGRLCAKHKAERKRAGKQPAKKKRAKAPAKSLFAERLSATGTIGLVELASEVEDAVARVTLARENHEAQKDLLAVLAGRLRDATESIEEVV